MNTVITGFIFPKKISQVALIMLQGGMSSLVITDVSYRAGMYIVTVETTSTKVIESYVNRTSAKNINFKQLEDIDSFTGYDAVYKVV